MRVVTHDACRNDSLVSQIVHIQNDGNLAEGLAGTTDQLQLEQQIDAARSLATSS